MTYMIEGTRFRAFSCTKRGELQAKVVYRVSKILFGQDVMSGRAGSCRALYRSRCVSGTVARIWSKYGSGRTASTEVIRFCHWLRMTNRRLATNPRPTGPQVLDLA